MITYLLASLLVQLCESKLSFVAVLARDGAIQMKNAKYFNITNDESIFLNPGRLTDVGKHQLHLLGRQLRYNYTKEKGLLSNEYNSNEVVFRSSGLNRTIESAQGFFSGFYHPGTGPILHNNLVKKAKPGIKVEDFQDIITELGSSALPYFMQPVPLHTTSEKKDYLFNAHTECTSLKADDKKYADEFREIDIKYEHLYKTLAKEYSYHVNSALEIYLFYENLASVIGNYGRDSVHLNDEIIDKLKEATLDQTLNMFLRSELKLKLMSYVILADIKEHLSNVVNKHNNNELKMAYYQTSDVHLLAIFKLIGIELPKEVLFGSSLILELSEEESNDESVERKYEIRLFYNGKLTKLRDKEVTEFKEFIKLIEGKMFKNMEEFMYSCLSNEEDEEITLSTGMLVIIIIIVAAIGLVVAVSFYNLCYRMEDEEELDVKVSNPVRIVEEIGEENKSQPDASQLTEIDKMSMLIPDSLIND